MVAVRYLRGFFEEDFVMERTDLWVLLDKVSVAMATVTEEIIGQVLAGNYLGFSVNLKGHMGYFEGFEAGPVGKMGYFEAGPVGKMGYLEVWMEG
jgi:hypothetical protein